MTMVPPGDAAAPQPDKLGGAGERTIHNPTPIPDAGEQLRRFVEALFEPEDLVEIRVIWPDRSAGIPARSQFLSARDLAAGTLLGWMQRQNAAGNGVYIGCNPRHRRGGKAADVALARCLVLDVDDGAAAEAVLRRAQEANLPAPTVVVSSGHGVHLWWRLDQPLPDLAAWTQRQKALITSISGTDTAIHDPPRVLRVPGLWNTKSEPVQCRLDQAHPNRSYELGEFPVAPVAATTSSAAAVSTKPEPATRKPLSRRTLEFIVHGTRGKQRNIELFAAACDAKGCGYTQSEALAKLVGPALRSPGDHPFTEDEARATIASAYRQDRTPSVGSVGPDRGGEPESWPEPQPLPEALPPVMPFHSDLLPEAFRAWVMDISERIQCAIDFVAIAAMVALSAIVGRKLGIRPKRHDDWTVVPNLWGGVVGRPGVMKTPSIQDPLRPMKKMEIEAKAAYDEQVKDAKADKRVAGVKDKELDKQIKKALANPQEARRLARESLSEDDGVAPVRKRYIVNDSTVEKLGEILNENPFGVLVFRDELIGLLKSLDKEGREGDRTFYLEAWNGTGRYTYDRIGRGTIDIDAAIVSILGGVQPGPLALYLRAAAREGAGDDGLIQRFQMLVWPDISRNWVNVDRWPAAAARDRAYEVFAGLDHIDPALFGADHDPFDSGGIPFLRFDDEAQVLFDSWRSELEREVRSGELHPALESHLSKYRSLIPSLALLIHLADGRRGPVGVDALRRAIRWGVYLRTHANRIYSYVVHPELSSARALARKLLDRELEGGFDLRTLYRKGWTGLSSLEDAQAAADYLVDLGWLLPVKRVTEGRTASRYLISPRIFEAGRHLSSAPPPSGSTDSTDTSPPQDPSVSSVSGPGGGEPGISPPPPPPASDASPDDDGEEEAEWTG